MASISIPDEKRTLGDVAVIREFLAPFGIWYEKWDVAGRLDQDASSEQILETYAPEIDRLKENGGFVTADVINVTPETPGLDAMVAKFAKEHTHSEDEVRFFVRGSGLFCMHIGDEVFAMLCEKDDLIAVPAGTRHWFDMGPHPSFTAIRFFNNPEGWVARFTGDGIAAGFPRYDN